YQAALRKFAYKTALTRNDYTKLVWGVKTFDRQAFSLAIDDLTSTSAGTPLGWAIKASEEELDTISGRKALIIFSDFKENWDFGNPQARVQELKTKYGSDFCLYNIYVEHDEKDIHLAQDLAQASGCGQAYDGCRLLKEQAYFDNMVKEVFGEAVVRQIMVKPACKNLDSKGICHDNDLCHNAPKGAQVDERGCWIAAYSQVFDFDKAVVKKAFLPNLKTAADVIKANPDITKIVIAGYTDSKGSEQYNYKLGLKRAEAIREILVKEGVAKNRLDVKSYGKTKPIADNKTEAGRSKNRRVEFHVVATK
ncbi:MAG: OmpA family protein, partial [Deltaproteobacteria bacterium]|nr:OmpA family protein [Deltaproteobacteria bacterium]